MTLPDTGPLHPYRVIRRIGRGGMADVFLGEIVDGPGSGQPVAIKRLLPKAAQDDELVDRFLGEADLARMVRHPSLVAVREARMVSGVPCLVMEFVDGRDLGQLLGRCKAAGIDLPVPFCTHIVGRVLEALSAVHAARGRDGTPLDVVHCDVNPSNVFISRLGEIKLADFGVAAVGALGGEHFDGRIYGKIPYLAPEQAAGLPLDGRTDLYAVGTVLYELLTMDRPFVGESLEELVATFQQEPPWAPSVLRADVPPALDDVVMRALALRPDDRYRSAEEMLEALAPFRDEVIGTDLAIASVVRGLFPA